MLNKAFINVFWIYNKAGFVINEVHPRHEFCFMEDMFTDLDISMVFYAAQEHVLKTKHSI